jgi:hypothetical protein
METMNQDIYYKSFNDFLADASIVYEKLKGDGFGYRYGQVYFNLLWEHRPDISEKIRGTSLDPFHKDAVLSATHQFVETSW